MGILKSLKVIFSRFESYYISLTLFIEKENNFSWNATLMNFLYITSPFKSNFLIISGYLMRSMKENLIAMQILTKQIICVCVYTP